MCSQNVKTIKHQEHIDSESFTYSGTAFKEGLLTFSNKALHGEDPSEDQ
jgi:hypothetical protein